MMGYFIDVSLLRQNRNFSLLYIGQLISFIGSIITYVALPYQIYHDTHSTLMVGMLSLVQLLPLLVTALIGGVLADRHHRKTLLLVAEALLAIGCLLLAFNAFSNTHPIWVIFVLASCMSAINGLHRPALDSIVQQLVSKKDFNKILGLITFKFNASMIIGPAIGGLLIAHFGLVTTYLVDFISFFISFIALLMIQNIPKPKTTQDESTWIALKQGFRYAMARQELLGTYFIDFIAMLFGMPTALFPAIAQSFGGAETLGMLYAAPAVGAVFISLVSGWAPRIKRHGIAIAMAAGLWGISIILFGLSTHLWLALFFLSLSGVFDAVSGMFRQMMWNAIIATEFRGRLAGIEMISYLSGPRLGDAEAGFIAAAFSVTTSIISGGVLCILGVAVCCYMLPKFWRYQAKISS